TVKPSPFKSTLRGRRANTTRPWCTTNNDFPPAGCHGHLALPGRMVAVERVSGKKNCPLLLRRACPEGLSSAKDSNGPARPEVDRPKSGVRRQNHLIPPFASQRNGAPACLVRDSKRQSVGHPACYILRIMFRRVFAILLLWLCATAQSN